MSDDPEPERNISGGDGAGGSVAAFDPGDADTRAEEVVDRLGELYWQKTYGGRSAFECLVRTVLSQNTSDAASQPAHDALMERYDGEDLAASLAAADRSALADTISAAGLYNRKSRTIIRLAEEVLAEYGGAAGFDAFVTGEGKGKLYHEAKELGVTVVLAGHYGTETFGVRSLASLATDWGLETTVLDCPTGL